MSSAHHRFERRAPLVVPAVSVIAVLILVPAEIGVFLVAALTAAVSILAYRLNNYLLAALSTAFLVRLGIVIADHTAGILPIPPIAPNHNQRAIELAAAWSNGQFFGVIGDSLSMRVLIAHVLAPFYVVLGDSPLAGRIGIAFVTLFVGYFVFLLARHVLDRRMSVFAAALVLFWPTIVYRSVVIQREIVIVVALLALLWAAIQWLDFLTLATVAVAVLATVTIFTLRKENLFLVAVIVGCTSLVKSRDRPYYLVGFALFAVPFLVFFALNFEQFTGHGTTLSPAALDSFAYGRAHGDAAYLIGLHYETWIDVILYAPIKVLYFLYTPFPWHIRGITELIVGLSAIGLFVTTVFARRGIGMLRDKPYYLVVLLSYLVTGVVTYAIIEMNYGAATRRRIQFVPVLLLLVVIGLSNVKLDVRWKSK